MTEPLLPREFPGGRLRRLRVSDFEAFQAYRALPELGRYQGWEPMTEAGALEFLAQMSQAALFVPGDWLQLGIATPDEDELIGDIGLYLSDDGTRGEIGFTLEPQAQGQGIAGRAAAEALDLLFARTAASEVRGITDARNAASIRLLERLGFVCVESREVQFRGETCTELVYVLHRGARG